MGGGILNPPFINKNATVSYFFCGNLRISASFPNVFCFRSLFPNHEEKLSSNVSTLQGLRFIYVFLLLKYTKQDKCPTTYVAPLLWPSVGVKPNTWKSWGFGVLQDSRMFRA